MKKVFIFILVLWVTSASFAQKKTIIAILPFKSDYLFNSSDQNAIADMVSLVFADSEDEISEAKVVSGGKEILNLFKENPSGIICITD